MFKFINNSTNKVADKSPIKESLINHEINIDSKDLICKDNKDIKVIKEINNDKIIQKEDTYDDIDLDKIC